MVDSVRGRDCGRGSVASIGIAALVLLAGLLLVGRLGSSGRVGILDTDPGDCFSLPTDPNLTELFDVTPQDCSEPHDAEVIAVGELNPDGARDYPDDELLFDLVDVACGDPRRYWDSGFGVLPVAPNERAWNGLQGRYVCVAVSLGGETVVGRGIPTGNGEESAAG